MEFELTQGFRLGDRAVYPALNRVVSGDDEQTVEGKVMAVLIALAKRPTGVVSKDELLDSVWPQQDVADGVLVRAVHELRRVLDDSARTPRYIENVPRVGYRLLQHPAPIDPVKNLRPTRSWLYTAIALAFVIIFAASIWHFSDPLRELVEAPIESIAVLPLVNMTGNLQKGHVADGLTEEVIHLMAQQPHLRVSARTSSFAVRDRGLTTSEIGRMLNVDSIIEGSVREERGTQRITLQLIHAATSVHRGSVTVDVREDDLFSAQQMLGDALISMLRDAGAVVADRLPTAGKLRNSIAYQLYLEARAALHARSVESLQKARSLLNEAIRLDPDFPQAHAILAQLYVVARYYLDIDAETSLRNKRAAYEKALALDPNNIDAMVVAATDAADRMEWDVAVEMFETAMRLHPSSVIAHLWYGQALIMAGHVRAGREHVEVAWQLDPLAASTNTVMAFAAGFFPEDSRLETAASQAEQYGSRLAPRFLALDAFRRRDFDTYERELTRMYGTLNINPEAARMIADAARDPALRPDLAERLEPFGHVRNNYFARELSLLGLHGNALEALLKNPQFEGTFASDVWLPEFGPMRTLPGFIELVRTLGVDEFWRSQGPPDACSGKAPEPFCSQFIEQ